MTFFSILSFCGKVFFRLFFSIHCSTWLFFALSFFIMKGFFSQERFRLIARQAASSGPGFSSLDNLPAKPVSAIALTSQNRIQNLHSTVSADVTEHMMLVEVYLVVNLLHVLNKHPRSFDQVLAMSLQGA